MRREHGGYGLNDEKTQLHAFPEKTQRSRQRDGHVQRPRGGSQLGVGLEKASGVAGARVGGWVGPSWPSFRNGDVI